ncbi:MAG: RNA methyltransferase, partial [Actinomycetaceae bacterium]|nr:RNA methyltransferase [Actinomycetaceae bacterium]
LVVMGLGTSDPGNAGTIMRSADGAGAGAVIFSQGSVECSNPKVVRASTGSYFHIPFIEDDDAVDVVLAARSYGFQVLIADAGGEMDLARLEDYALLAFLERHSEALARDAFGALLNTASDCDRTIVDLSRPTLWVFGNEAHGFTADELKLADARVRVPMWGNTESLNLGVAASLCIFASAKAQHRAH